MAIVEKQKATGFLPKGIEKHVQKCCGNSEEGRQATWKSSMKFIRRVRCGLIDFVLLLFSGTRADVRVIRGRVPGEEFRLMRRRRERPAARNH